ncbi:MULTISPECIES: azurin [Oligella]|uniref:Azurin n=1 Tax=Oligella urethralis DNF00040 TaxID=1401065 RepID=A0A095Z7I0_9BURK|nr:MULTISPECIES: azurin [Oligella]KGF30685.1 azurin [Oligella urethralis DNF00040]OFS88437.1 azurin [Oligella sp. HMSC05A10]WOS38162.1 Azurin [Oligella urethralis]SUA65131.1 Azurin [Oligella urethralis]SUA94534.1 Azurin [Oligella urethralis]
MKIKSFALAALLSAAAPAMAAECTINIEGNDAMQYNVKEIEVSKSCDEVTLNLKHVGNLPKAAMGHNVVISKAADAQAIATEAAAAGPANDYLNKDDERIIAHTDMVGGGEETSVKFKPSVFEEGESYEFFCSFPGHFAIMKGSVKLVD